MDATTPAPALPFPEALEPLPEIITAWQTRWDDAWQSLHDRAQRLRRERQELEHERLAHRADHVLRTRELQYEADVQRSRRAIWKQELTGQREELTDLRADAADAWRSVAAERAAWEQWEAEHAAARLAKTEELAGLEQRIQHQRQILAHLAPPQTSHATAPQHDSTAGTVETTPSLITIVGELVQDVADQARLLDEQWQMLERLKAFWTRRWEQVAESHAARDETLERRERGLDLREGWLRQKETTATHRADKLRDLQAALAARQALLTRKESRHQAQRSKLAMAIKRRSFSVLREEPAEVFSTLSRDAALDLHQAELKRLREDRTLLRKQVRVLEEELEQLAFSLLEEPAAPTLLRLVA